MLERFTPEARGVVTRAVREAGAPQRRLVDTEHLLLALLTGDTDAEAEAEVEADGAADPDPDAGAQDKRVDGDIAFTVLRNAGLSAAGVRADIERLLAAPEKLLTTDETEALRTIGIDADAVLARIEESFGPGAAGPGAGSGGQEPRRGLLGRRNAHPGGRTRFSERGRKVLELSVREAQSLHHDYIGTEHLLLGLIREGDGLAMKIVTDAGSSPDDLRAATIAALPGG